MPPRSALLAFALFLLGGPLLAGTPGAAPLAQPPPAQGAVAPSPAPPLSGRATVSLLTILPGEGAADAFGHSAFRVRDPARRLDRTYNYGTYRFGPYFIPKFVYGQLTYLLSTSPFRQLMRRYRVQERSVIEHRLNLSAAQEQRLFRFLERNAQPEHRAYRYDFLFDNCATRLRDALRDALGDTLRFDRAALPQRTFRHHLDRFVIDKPPIDVGFALALGTPTDRVATPREAMFLPEYLMEAVAGGTLGRGAARRPLAAAADTLFWVAGDQFPARPAFSWPTALGWALFAAFLGLTAWRRRRRRPPLRSADALLFGAVGLAGVVIWFLAFFSEHVVTRYNFNIVWALPSHLFAAVALGRGRREGRLLRGYLLASGVAALVLVGGWPWWPQDLHAAVLPLVLTLALRSAALAWPARRNARAPTHASAAQAPTPSSSPPPAKAS